MRYCDHQGWSWDPVQGPSPCVGETMSLWLALGFLVSATRTTSSRRGDTAGGPYYRYAGLSPSTLVQPNQYRAPSSSGRVWGAARRIHRMQVALCLFQTVVALANGLLCSRPRGMLSLSLVLHTAGWTLAWAVGASELRRNPSLSRVLVWWWLAGAVSNRCVHKRLG